MELVCSLHGQPRVPLLRRTIMQTPPLLNCSQDAILAVDVVTLVATGPCGVLTQQHRLRQLICHDPNDSRIPHLRTPTRKSEAKVELHIKCWVHHLIGGVSENYTFFHVGLGNALEIKRQYNYPVIALGCPSQLGPSCTNCFHLVICRIYNLQKMVDTVFGRRPDVFGLCDQMLGRAGASFSFLYV